MPDIKYHIRRRDKLRSDRYNWDSQWEETAKRLVPAHVATFYGNKRFRTQGQKNTATNFYDSTGALALSRAQAVFESLATPRHQQWHRLVPSNPELRKDRQVMAYMEALTRALFRERYRPGANFVSQNQKTLNSYLAYGNGGTFVDEDPNGGIRYKNLHLGGLYIAENHQGVIDTMYRDFALNPRQIVKMFMDNGSVPQAIAEAAMNEHRMEDEEDILHAIVPRSDYMQGGLGGETMPWESVYILEKMQAVLRVGGYNTFPLAFARYMQYSGEDYGRGPGQMVLPALKLLDAQKKTVIKQGNRVVDPVLLMHDDGMMGTFSLMPGAVNAGGVNAEGRPLVHTLPTGDLAIADKMMEMEKDAINDAFMITLFQILTENPRMTATEVIERTQEKGMLIAPTAGRLQSEYLSPMIEREIDVLAMQGRLPEPPPALLEAGGEYEVEYESPMARMARAENASGFARSLEIATNVASVTQDPGMYDHFNFDVAIPEMNEINGVPITWTNDIETVKAKRKAREEKQQQMAMMENAAGLATAVKAGAELQQPPKE